MESNTVVFEFFLALGVIILISKMAGAVARRLGQPRVFGELLAGVLLGPTLLNFLHWSAIFDPAFEHDLELAIHEMAELGVLLLMFIVGLDVHIKELVREGKVAAIGGVLGAVTPVALAMPVALVFGFSMEAALFIGVTMAATSVSISAQTLLELGLLRTKEGYALLATALIDDVLAILLVSFAVATTSGDGASAGDLGLIVLQMAVYIIGAVLLAWFVLPRALNWVHRRPEAGAAYGVPAMALVAALVFGWAAESIGGVAAITGAFIAGVGISRTLPEVKREVENTVRGIAYAFLVPVFFVSVGLSTDLGQSLNALPFALLLLVTAVISKLIGVGGGALLGGFEWQRAGRLGICMISRGEVGLIIASIGLSRGAFDDTIFPALFLVILLTTVLTPLMVRWAFRTPLLEPPSQGDQPGDSPQEPFRRRRIEARQQRIQNRQRQDEPTPS